MKDEDNFGTADVPVAITPRNGNVVLLQMDGKLTQDEFKKAFRLAVKGDQDVYEIQKQALLSKSKTEVIE
ncbi:Exosome complex component Rrp41 [uncultured archaeon]|nr:Exosome complex component Rrp41 [uncultured archaeon]